jgi:N-acetylglucosamine-6-phosphate deacetylase
MLTINARSLETSEPVRISIRNGRIVSVVPDPAHYDTSELPFVASGLLDLQVNGYRGFWFNSEHLTPDDVRRTVFELLQQGLTRCLPTLITASSEAILHGLRTIRNVVDSDPLMRSAIAGCHVEGPFISPLDGPRGAHSVEHVRPASMAEVDRWQSVSGGLLRLVTLAPEVPGAEQLIPELVRRGITVAIGHSAADIVQIRRAIDLGATLGTHIGNGCAALIPRHDNPIWPQLADNRLTCSVIADGWHVPADFLQCLTCCKSPDRIVLTSDVSGFAGCPSGNYDFGNMRADVLADGRIVAAGQTQFLAGSSATLAECVSNVVSAGLMTLNDAWNSASVVPARLLKLPVPQLREGAAAKLTLFETDTTSCPESGRHTVTIRPRASIIDGIRIDCRHELTDRDGPRHAAKTQSGTG